MKYLRSATSGCKDIGTIKSENLCPRFNSFMNYLLKQIWKPTCIIFDSLLIRMVRTDGSADSGRSHSCPDSQDWYDWRLDDLLLRRRRRGRVCRRVYLERSFYLGISTRWGTPGVRALYCTARWGLVTWASKSCKTFLNSAMLCKL